VSDPFKIDGKTYLAFSAGRSSALMLHRTLEANAGQPEDLMVCFQNTGREDEASLRFVDRISREWGVRIVWLEYVRGGIFTTTTFEYARRNGEPFEAVIEQRGGVLPNPISRYCSSEMKTRTAHRYLRSLGWEEWDTFLGIRADEPRRVAKFRANPHPETKSETVHLPLAEAGIGAKDVATFWRAQPFDLELPNNNGKTMHGNCDLCFLKPAAQVLSLITEKPERAAWWIAQERTAEAVATGNGCRFRDDRPSYAQMARFAADQRDMFDPNEEAIACFCGD